MNSRSIQIGEKSIGPGRSAYIMAEVSANHNKDFDQAIKLIEAAKLAGADAVKLQTFMPDTITIDVESELFRVGAGSPWAGRTLYDLYEDAYMPWEWQPKLKAIANKLGMDLFSTAFDSSAVDFLEDMDVAAHKVASFELVDIPLIEKMARTDKPLIISTGMGSKSEIEDAVSAARNAGAKQIALLKCTSAYPALPENMNLAMIKDLADIFRVPVGLSDHTLGIAVPVAAVALGACIVEKHFTLSREIKGPDSAFSLEPHEFKAMVDAVRIAEQSIGEIHYGPSEAEEKSKVFRRSLFVIKGMLAGEVFTKENIRSIRPGYGLAPKHLPDVLGKKAVTDIRRGTPLAWELVR